MHSSNKQDFLDKQILFLFFIFLKFYTLRGSCGLRGGCRRTLFPPLALAIFVSTFGPIA